MCPWAGKIGASWMTREDRLSEIDDYVRYLDALVEELEVADRSLTVLGFSQGVATATRWVVRGATRPSRLILWGDVAPPDLDLERAGRALSGIRLELVRGDEDRAFDAQRVEEEAARLRDAGVVYSVVGYRGGHEVDADTLLALADGSPLSPS